MGAWRWKSTRLGLNSRLGGTCRDYCLVFLWQLHLFGCSSSQDFPLNVVVCMLIVAFWCVVTYGSWHAWCCPMNTVLFYGQNQSGMLTKLMIHALLLRIYCIWNQLKYVSLKFLREYSYYLLYFQFSAILLSRRFDILIV